MRIASTMINALNDSICEKPSIIEQRFPVLQEWFSDTGIDKFIYLYQSLADSKSKSTLLKLLYNSIGVFLAGNIEKFRYYTTEEWNNFEEEIKRFKLPFSTYNLDIIETWILEGYAYKNDQNNICIVNTGDIIIDCGAYTGNTSYYFSMRTGKDGLVYSLEAMPQTFEILKKNIKDNKFENIRCYNYAVDEECGEANFSANATPGAKKINENGIKVPQISIDEFTRINSINKVDFIKMDIEGSENNALRGARETIRRYHPKLAICLYHRPEDFITIPSTINDIYPYYKFYLKHNSFNFWETVLFAVPQNNKNGKIEINEQEKSEIKSIYNLMLNVYTSRKQLIKESLLRSYVFPIEEKYQFLGPAIFNQNYNYAFWPLSENHKLHFEYLFSGNTIEISLHFEDKYAEQREIIEYICNNSYVKLRNNSGSCKGCAIIVKELNKVKEITSYMDWLIQYTLPILYEKRLLSDRLVLNKTVQNICHKI